jgi:hypothetical protein
MNSIDKIIDGDKNKSTLEKIEFITNNPGVFKI